MYAYYSNGNLNKVDESMWSLIPAKQDMTEADIYEIHVKAEDNSILDIDNDSKSVTISALLVIDRVHKRDNKSGTAVFYFLKNQQN